MNWLWRLLFYFLGQQAKLRLLREIRCRGVLAYLRALQATRRLLIALLLAFMGLQVMLLGFAGTVWSGLQLLEVDEHTRLQVVFAVSVGLFALPAAGLCLIFSERLWYKASGAQEMVERLRARD